MRAAFQWTRHLFEAWGAVTLLISAGIGTAAATVVAGLMASLSWPFRVLLLIGTFMVVAGASLAVANRWRSRSADRPDHLADEYRAFARELGQFLAARRYGRPVFRRGTYHENVEARASLPPIVQAAAALSGSATDWVGRRRRAEIAGYDQETLRDFHDRFGAQGVALFDRALDEGVADARDETLVTEPGSATDLDEIVVRFRGYADVADPTASAARREARLAVLLDRLDGLMDEGIGLRNRIANAPAAEAISEGTYGSSALPSQEVADAVSAFDERARRLLRENQAALMQDYTEAANACLRRPRDGERSASPVDLTPDAWKQMRDGPLVLYMDAYLEGLAAVRDRLRQAP